MSGNQPSPTETRKIGSTHMGSGSQPSLRLRVDAGSAMLSKMSLNGLAGRFRDVQHEVDGSGIFGPGIWPQLFGGRKLSQGALHRQCLGAGKRFQRCLAGHVSAIPSRRRHPPGQLVPTSHQMTLDAAADDERTRAPKVRVVEPFDDDFRRAGKPSHRVEIARIED